MKLNDALVSIRKFQAPYGYPASENQDTSSMIKNKQKEIKKGTLPSRFKRCRRRSQIREEKLMRGFLGY